MRTDPRNACAVEKQLLGCAVVIDKIYKSLPKLQDARATESADMPLRWTTSRPELLFSLKEETIDECMSAFFSVSERVLFGQKYNCFVKLCKLSPSLIRKNRPRKPVSEYSTGQYKRLCRLGFYFDFISTVRRFTTVLHYSSWFTLHRDQEPGYAISMPNKLKIALLNLFVNRAFLLKILNQMRARFGREYGKGWRAGRICDDCKSQGVFG